MLPEYLKYWGLSKPPFSLTPDPDMLYMSKYHQEGLIRLKYAVVSNKGGALLVSEHAGDGKTSLLARLRRELDHQYQGNCRTVFIDHPTLTANQMIGEITRQFGMRSNTTDKLTLLNDLRRFLLESHGRNEKCVVMLDEGQMLCNRPDLLQELRILLNFCVSDAFLITFIFSGQKPLDEAIRAMPEFYQRLPVRFFLRNLNLDDTRELIRYRLHMAGNSPDREMFSEDGYSGIYNFSEGCPRIICSVADLALVIAHSRFSSQVDFVSVSHACSDMNRTDGAYHYFHFLKSFNADQELAPDQVSAKEAALSCPGCGGGVLAKAKFCQHCGMNLVDSKTVSAEQAPEPSEPAQAETPVQKAESSAPVQLEEASEKETEETLELQQRASESLVEHLPPSASGKPAPPEADQSPEPKAGEESVEKIEQAPEAGFQAKESVKICPDCGGGVPENAKFCQHCGTNLVAPESAAFEEIVMKGDQDQAEKAPAPEEIRPSEEPAESVTEAGEKSTTLEEKAASGQVSPDNRSLKFMLESEEPPQDAEDDMPGDQEEFEAAGAERPAEETKEVRDKEPGEEELVAAPEEKPSEEPEESQTAEEPELGEAEEIEKSPEPQPEMIKCSFCGLDLSAEILECPNCGEKLQKSDEEEPPQEEGIISLATTPQAGQPEEVAAGGVIEANGSAGKEEEKIQGEPSLEQNLLREVEELDLYKFILSESYLQDRRVPDPLDEELLVFPLRRFCGQTPVVKFTDGDRQESFTTRCGLVFTGSSLRFIFSNGLREISYRIIEKVDVEELAKNDKALLYQLILSTSTGSYQITLPFKASVAKRLGETLQRYLAEKVGGLAGAAETSGVNSNKEEREEDAG